MNPEVGTAYLAVLLPIICVASIVFFCKRRQYPLEGRFPRVVVCCNALIALLVSNWGAHFLVGRDYPCVLLDWVSAISLTSLLLLLLLRAMLLLLQFELAQTVDGAHALLRASPSREVSVFGRGSRRESFHASQVQQQQLTVRPPSVAGGSAVFPLQPTTPRHVDRRRRSRASLPASRAPAAPANWWLQHRWLARRRFLTALFCAHVAYWALSCGLWLAFGQVGEGCLAGDNKKATHVTFGFGVVEGLTISVLLARVGWRLRLHGTDSFGVKAEFKALAVGAVVTIAYVACWIPFAPSLGYERNRTINELTWSVAAVGVFAIGTLYPLFLCVAHEREMRAQLRAVHAISTVQELLSFNAGFEAFFKFSRAEFSSENVLFVRRVDRFSRDLASRAPGQRQPGLLSTQSHRAPAAAAAASSAAAAAATSGTASSQVSPRHELAPSSSSAGSPPQQPQLHGHPSMTLTTQLRPAGHSHSLSAGAALTYSQQSPEFVSTLTPRASAAQASADALLLSGSAAHGQQQQQSQGGRSLMAGSGSAQAHTHSQSHKRAATASRRPSLLSGSLATLTSGEIEHERVLNSTAIECFEDALVIYRQYVIVGAPYQINTSSEIRDRVRLNLLRLRQVFNDMNVHTSQPDPVEIKIEGAASAPGAAVAVGAGGAADHSNDVSVLGHRSLGTGQQQVERSQNRSVTHASRAAVLGVENWSEDKTPAAGAAAAAEDEEARTHRLLHGAPSSVEDEEPPAGTGAAAAAAVPPALNTSLSGDAAATAAAGGPMDPSVTLSGRMAGRRLSEQESDLGVATVIGEAAVLSSPPPLGAATTTGLSEAADRLLAEEIRHVFDEAKHDVLAMLQGNAFMRFRSSQQYRELEQLYHPAHAALSQQQQQLLSGTAPSTAAVSPAQPGAAPLLRPVTPGGGASGGSPPTDTQRAWSSSPQRPGSILRAASSLESPRHGRRMSRPDPGSSPGPGSGAGSAGAGDNKPSTPRSGPFASVRARRPSIHAPPPPIPPFPPPAVVASASAAASASSAAPSATRGSILAAIGGQLTTIAGSGSNVSMDDVPQLILPPRPAAAAAATAADASASAPAAAAAAASTSLPGQLGS